MSGTPAHVAALVCDGTTSTTPTSSSYLVDPSVMYQFIVDIDQLFDTTKMHQFFVGFKQSN